VGGQARALALALASPRIGSEHLLLALTVTAGPVADTLERYGATTAGGGAAGGRWRLGRGRSGAPRADRATGRRVRQRGLIRRYEATTGRRVTPATSVGALITG
jgi:Clp amino terminal domain, pathogenicity island component